MTSPNQVPRPTDEQLVLRVLGGDDGAVRELLGRYRDMVFRKSLLMSRDWDIADSAAHETFVNALDGLEGFDPKRRFKTWLLKIAKNAVLKRLDTQKKKKKKHGMLEIRGSLMEDTPDTEEYVALLVSSREEDPLEAVISGERNGELMQAIARLKVKHREAFLLDVEGMPHDEIARKMGVPVNTVRSYIHRAKKKLQEMLTE